MPEYWKFEFDGMPTFLRLPLQTFLTLICLASLGHRDLTSYWEVCSDERRWLESNDRLMDRLNAIVLVAGLVLSSNAAFLTTAPPIPADFNYNEYKSYICLLISFTSALGTLIVGSGITFIMAKCSQDCHLGSRSRILCTMYLISFPFASISFSGAIGALGTLIL
ncbi:hypothetical protein PsYK624_001660 [Phanerochaete sordida]|uniref:Uncharacterized protein n=1 Tax=Phanerochaete sordida TaxID=48140 RepID=A0A9P3FWX0_9APHY|nr:hypothetical protein PsYK624_001660 [Phanerochaete sordida]